jgi:hypothetical protein
LSRRSEGFLHLKVEMEPGAGRTLGQKSDGWVSLVAFAVHGIWQFHELFEARPQRGVLSSRG